MPKCRHKDSDREENLRYILDKTCGFAKFGYNDVGKKKTILS